ncbi:hypothetical protein LDENG_00205060, partial [Lucifuga dentata]
MSLLRDGDITSAVFSSLNILTRPVGDASVHDAPPSSQKEVFLLALHANRAVLLEKLQREKSFEDVRRLRAEVMAGAEWFLSDTDDTAWGFVQECLLLLLTLVRHLSSQLELFNATPSSSKLRTSEMAPPLPPDVLSITQQKMLGSALQFVVSLGLCPYLELGVGVSLSHRSAFGVMVEGLFRRDAALGMERRLLTTTNVLLQLAELSSLATQVFMRHLGDIMAALCQLGYRPHTADGSSSEEKDKLSAEERRVCRETLKSLLGKVYQPVVIKELLVLQGTPRQQSTAVGMEMTGSRAAAGSSPPWLRRLCGQLLSERLVQPSGVQAVVRAILEGGTGESAWRKCNGLARILITIPQQSASAENYYRKVCPQIVDLLHFEDKQTAQQFQCVATRAVLLMVQDRPSFAQRFLLAPLLAPLHSCLSASDKGNIHTAVEEQELTRCVEDVYK